MSQLKGKELAAFTYHQTEKVIQLQEENAKLKEQNIQYEFALKLLIEELNELKD